MAELKDLVDFHISEINTVSDVAGHLNTSAETLRKYFLRKEKIHLHDYIYERKVQLIKELLMNSDDSCYRICDSAGLREDTGAKIFKKITGLTIQGFREKYKNEYELLKNDSLQTQRLHLLLAEAFDFDPNCDERCGRHHRRGYHNIYPPLADNTTQHNTTQHNTTQHNTTQHNTTQHNTTQHNTTQQPTYGEKPKQNLNAAKLRHKKLRADLKDSSQIKKNKPKT